ncbi:TPA: helix-turn-helix transcriptional regulator [Pseudomonas aeruginosa]|uniref:helix-turn-helix transcriptional regulator n=1 Tax=Pseudomonas TaxID=286 RepID=UPI00053EC345|nr:MULTISPECIES: helix-turn-helix transcriptional regulator [Pseudomonas]EKJ8516302.1 helix-turn-helix domain-containing protein [Pseudomonas aeruginosa]EKV6262297.1 helix-turn-helix domain-containing protein [Pseudomonas aeruginosa]EKX6243532.1 helix-turn-helix domain-containing protein [Pseudomonas aeruginosa]EKZ9522668.1 helix-turn-helix domain-containing protein [Pseudomonas aeruginosa]ELK7307829.1 helix-turn-helix domain-containing protein [Pseudomonas aeruginosa]
MKTSESSQQPRPLTPTELAQCVRLFREANRWSQEQLAGISGLSERTIQRVEKGLSGDFNTRRALARAFEFEDIDVFNKAYEIPSEEELRAAQEKYDKENVTLAATPLTTGRQLAKLVTTSTADMSEPAFELTREAEEAFSGLVDYFREYRDCADLYSERQKIEVYDEMQSFIDALNALGVSLVYSERKVKMKWGTNPASEPMPAKILYVVAFPMGEEPTQFATPKSGAVSL